MKRLWSLLVVLFLLAPNAALAASVEGKVTREKTGEALPKALVVFILEGEEKARTTTSDDGYYYVHDLSKGRYTVEVKYRGQVKTFENVVLDTSEGIHDFEI